MTGPVIRGRAGRTPLPRGSAALGRIGTASRHSLYLGRDASAHASALSSVATPSRPYQCPPPATRGRHPPPEAIHSLKGKPETGMYAAALGRDDRPGHPRTRPPYPRSRHRRAPTRAPHLPPEAATRHPKRCRLTFALLHRPKADLHLCTVSRLPCQRVNLPTSQLVCLVLVHRASEPPGL
jgi:hypothetical protein